MQTKQDVARKRMGWVVGGSAKIKAGIKVKSKIIGAGLESCIITVASVIRASESR